MKKDTNIKDSMRTLAELLNWEYKKSKVTSAGFDGKNIIVSLKEFNEFVFPNCMI
ncbi:MAG: hypothetical protein NKF70_06780 [Methanobacterium sp. ERen5]|nr:MAG: hypothetical protein NKF70_06780 [Methanobacterium sp. ERen5]